MMMMILCPPWYSSSRLVVFGSTVVVVVVVVVVVIAQQFISYRQLSRLRKSATAAGLSHRSCTASCVGYSDGFDSLWNVVQHHTPDKHLICCR